MTTRPSTELELRHPRGRTPIHVGVGALGEPGPLLEEAVTGRTVFLITSEVVRSLHGSRVHGLRGAAAGWVALEVPEGERAKELAVAEELWREMLRRGGKRDSLVIALGGGSVGDLAGFVAGGFLRGIDCVQAPTTLLAQVDAAIGGKTAVNLPEAKNSVGLFHHPVAVVCDTEVLATLDPAELRSGLFEVVKIAAVCSPELLGVVDRDLDGLLAADAGLLVPVVADAIRAKVDVVESDPEESDRRRLLNFGHTVGHALESLGEYRALRHGEAVGYGMLFALALARRRGLDAAEAEAVRDLIRRIGLPPLPEVSPGAILERVARDKKARESGLAWVYPRALGDGRIDETIEISEIEEILDRFVADPWAG